VSWFVGGGGMNERDTAHAQALRLALIEVDRLREGIQWAQGMCNDREPTGEIGAYLRVLLDARKRKRSL
jgi:hypothetical protein